MRLILCNALFLLAMSVIFLAFTVTAAVLGLIACAAAPGALARGVVLVVWTTGWSAAAAAWFRDVRKGLR